MITLNTEKTTGKQLYRTITQCLKDRGREIGRPVSKGEFLRESEISRATFWGFKRGDKPSPNMLIRVAQILTAWGYDVEVKFK